MAATENLNQNMDLFPNKTNHPTCSKLCPYAGKSGVPLTEPAVYPRNALSLTGIDLVGSRKLTQYHMN